jgi:hypothetical protein
MKNGKSMVIEQAFTKEIGISIYSAMKVLNEAGMTTEDLSDIANLCKTTLANEIERRNVPYEFRFLLLSFVLCRMFKTSTTFHKEYMESIGEQLKLSQSILNDKDEQFPDIELAKRPQDNDVNTTNGNNSIIIRNE